MAAALPLLAAVAIVGAMPAVALRQPDVASFQASSAARGGAESSYYGFPHPHVPKFVTDAGKLLVDEGKRLAELPGEISQASRHAVHQVLNTFESFHAHFRRPYLQGSAEYTQRKVIFEERLGQIMRLNSINHLWRAGVNHLTDRTEEELAQMRGYRGRGCSLSTCGPEAHMSPSHVAFEMETRSRSRAVNLPATVSWHHLNATKLVKDQGACGSCWAIATTSVVEAHREIKFNKHDVLSTQELVSCVPNPNECGGVGGCEGATMELALEWILKNGISTEKDLPYQGTDLNCKRSLMQLRGTAGAGQGGHLAGEALLGITGWRKLPENQMEPMMRALMEGPVGVAVAARDWTMYDEGIFDSCDRDAVTDHVAILVAYGEDNDHRLFGKMLGKSASAKYWTIQNSWSTLFGEAGYIRLLRHPPKAPGAAEEEWCGVDRDPKVGSGCKGGPSEVKVCGMCGILYDTARPFF